MLSIDPTEAFYFLGATIGFFGSIWSVIDAIKSQRAVDVDSFDAGTRFAAIAELRREVVRGFSNLGFFSAGIATLILPNPSPEQLAWITLPWPAVAIRTGLLMATWFQSVNIVLDIMDRRRLVRYYIAHPESRPIPHRRSSDRP